MNFWKWLMSLWGPQPGSVLPGPDPGPQKLPPMIVVPPPVITISPVPKYSNLRLLVVDNGIIYTDRPKGREFRFLGQGQHANWVNRNEIIYSDNRQIYTMDENGGDWKKIGNIGNIGCAMPQKVGDLICFMGGNGGVFLMQQDGNGLRELLPQATGRPGEEYAMQPYLANGYVVFVWQTQPYHRRLERIGVDGKDRMQLTFLDFDSFRPDCNAPFVFQDDKIAFFSGKESAQLPGPNPESDFDLGFRDISIMNKNGAERKILTNCTPIYNQMERDRLSPYATLIADNPSGINFDGRVIFDWKRKDKVCTGVVNQDGSGIEEFYPKLRGSVRNSVVEI